MGYRSSMPIIELKLTGPASEQQAMEKLWLDVKRVAGQSVIFEGTEGLPAQISRELQEPPVQSDAERAIHRWFIGFATFSRRCSIAGV